MIKAKTTRAKAASPFVQMPFNEYLLATGVSNSTLKEFMRNPRAFSEGRIREQTGPQAIGTILHDYVLEGQVNFLVAPDTYTSEKGEVKPWNMNSKVCKEWAKYNSDKNILSASEAEMVMAARDAAMSDPWASPLLRGDGETEACLFADYKGIRLKGRLDRFVKRNRMIVDLKTTVDAELESFRRDSIKYGYHRQMAFYQLLCELNGIQCDGAIIIAMEKTRYADIGVYQMSEEALRVGRAQIDEMLGLFIDCTKSGVWPGYSGSDPSVLKEIQVPAFLSERYPVEVRI